MNTDTMVSGRATGRFFAALCLLSACYLGPDSESAHDTEGGATAADAGSDTGASGDGSTGAEVPAECVDAAPSVGPTALRRLTRRQYQNTIRDLLGIESKVVDDFAPDDRAGPFVTAVSPVDETIAEQYMLAAEQLAQVASTRLDPLLGCDPQSTDESSCAAMFIADFGRRAFRRPLAAGEAQAFVTLYETARATTDFSGAISVVIEAMLQAPQFLYHLEFGSGDVGDIVELSGYELASRLSYFLWNSMPDDELFDAADTGLGTAAELRAQAERMLDDPRAKEAIASFHLQWTGADTLELAAKDPVLYPEFDDEMRAAMLAETTDFADYVIRHGDGRLETLLTAPFSIIEGPLYELYGVAATTSPNGDPTTPLDESQRAGILTHASVMAAQAHSEQTSPVLRGLFVRQSLLCQPMPPPPADVNNTPPPPDPNATTKERFNEHTQDPACAGCHLLIDPVGWGFEQYDAIGRYRTMEGSNPVDARGEITGTADADGEFDGAVELAQLLAGSEQVGECVAKQWFRFAFGRSEVEEDTCSIATTHSLFADAGYDIRELLLTIVVSDTFRHRRLSQ